MFAPSLNLDLSKLAQSEEQPASKKKVAAKGSKARKGASGSDKTAKKA
jgi:hypothetical protein